MKADNFMETNSIEFNWTMLENGLDFLDFAVNNLEQLENDNSIDEDTQRRLLKYSITNMSSGIELIIKHKLFSANWTYIFSKLDDASNDKLEKGDFSSIDSDTAIKRLENLCDIKLDTSSLKKLKDFRLKRNKMEHYRLIDNYTALLILNIDVLSIVIDFIEKHITPDKMNDNENYLYGCVKEKLGSIEKFILIREEKLRLEFPDFNFMICPMCGKKWLDSNGEFVNCRLCFYEDSVTAAAENYIDRVMNLSRYEIGKDGGEYPLYPCPDCGKECFVYDNLINYIGFCYSCEINEKFDYFKFCSRCGSICSKEDIEICNNCFDDIIQHND